MEGLASRIDLFALALVVLPVSFWVFRAWQVRVPRTLWPFFVAWAGGTLLGVLALRSGQDTGFAWTAVGMGVVLTYLVTTGRQRAEPQVAVGERVPAFESVTADGEAFTDEQLLGAPTLIKFFRGHW